MLRVDKANANDISKSHVDLLKEVKVDFIFNDNIEESNLISTGYIVMRQERLFSQSIWFQVNEISEKRDSQKKNLSL